LKQIHQSIIHIVPSPRDHSSSIFVSFLFFIFLFRKTGSGNWAFIFWFCSNVLHFTPSVLLILLPYNFFEAFTFWRPAATTLVAFVCGSAPLPTNQVYKLLCVLQSKVGRPLMFVPPIKIFFFFFFFVNPYSLSYKYVFSYIFHLALQIVLYFFPSPFLHILLHFLPPSLRQKMANVNTFTDLAHSLLRGFYKSCLNSILFFVRLYYSYD
jgi:hypothetical protein